MIQKLHRLFLVLGLLLATIGAAWVGWEFHARASRIEGAARIEPAPRIEARPNVVLISIDTCRADRLSCYGYHRPTTPNIDAVARDGAMFKMAITPVPLTTPAHSSMFTGMYPPTHRVRLNTFGHLADSNVTLATKLREAGYHTAAFVAAFPLGSRFGLNQGFETYDGQFSEEGKKGFFSRRTGAEVDRPALAWLQDHAQKPFFLFLHYYDAHHPYQPHPPLTAAFADDPYAGQIAYVDHCIGRVLDRLRALGVYENTLVIITGDHGEAMGEHGEDTHGFFMYQSTLHVPLVIRAPGGKKGIQADENVSLVDIVPTVLDLLGLKIPARVEGVSLCGALEGEQISPLPHPSPLPEREGTKRAIYAESLEPGTYGCSPLHGILEAGWKYILAPRPELYDLTRDPGERTNLAGQQPEVAKRLRSRLEAMRTELKTSATPRRPAIVSPEVVKRLESLGYVSGATPRPASAADAAREDPKDFLPTYQRLLRLLHTTAQSADARHNEAARQELLEISAARPRLILPHQLLAGIALAQRRPADAVAQYAMVVAMLGEVQDPSKQGLRGMEELARAHFGLGLALEQTGKLAEAIAHYEQALRIVPEYADADLNLGTALQKTGRLPEAIAHYEQALRSEPDFADAHYNLAVALALQGNAEQAAAHYAEALRLQADYPGALNNLAWIRATNEDPRLRDGPEAVRLAQRACQLTGSHETGALDTLAAAYAEAGRLPEAIATAGEAVALARSVKQPALARAIQSRLERYRAGRPYREPSAKSPQKPSGCFNSQIRQSRVS